MVEILGNREGKVDKIEVVFTTVFYNLSFLKDFIGLEDHETASGLKRFQRRMTELVTTQNTADLYAISAGWDPRGLKRKCSACIGEIFAIWRESASRKEENQIHDPPKEMPNSEANEQRQFIDAEIEVTITNLIKDRMFLEVANKSSNCSNSTWSSELRYQSGHLAEGSKQRDFAFGIRICDLWKGPYGHIAASKEILRRIEKEFLEVENSWSVRKDTKSFLSLFESWLIRKENKRSKETEQNYRKIKTQELGTTEIFHK
ncbi:(S)-N-methylcoclaurine 3'-hydroxylase isozyme [Salix suchowensis]|nr:(S)-N-methylcoclaurine 3'-hydroxylase isozyme [Salix suchowensis]